MQPYSIEFLCRPLCSLQYTDIFKINDAAAAAPKYRYAHLRDSFARLRDLTERVHGLRLLLDEQVLLLAAAGGAQLGEGLEAELLTVGVDCVE